EMLRVFPVARLGHVVARLRRLAAIIVSGQRRGRPGAEQQSAQCKSNRPSHDCRNSSCHAHACSPTPVLLYGCPPAAVPKIDTALLRATMGRRHPPLSSSLLNADCPADVAKTYMIERP